MFKGAEWFYVVLGWMQGRASVNMVMIMLHKTRVNTNKDNIGLSKSLSHGVKGSVNEGLETQGETQL